MKKILVLGLLLLMSSIACKKLNTMNGKYEWLVETVADYGYPMKILGGSFLDDKGNVLAGIPADMYLSGQWWNGDSGTVVAGEDFRSLPSMMNIRWFSYAEDKFYEGKFNLDHKKLEEEFNKTFKCRSGNKSYSSIKVAIAPAGQVFLYLTGSNIKFFGNYQAQEIFISDFKEEMRYTVDENRMEFLKDYISEMALQTQLEIKQGTIRKDIWKDINIKYPWNYTYEVIDDKRPLKILKNSQGADFISGEQTWCLEEENYFTSPILKAVPTEIDAKFETQAGMELVVRIYPGNVNGAEPNKQSYAIRRAREQELVKLFKDFYEKIGKQPFSIHLRISDDFKNGKVFLKKGVIEQEITNVEVQIFNTTFDN